LLFNFDTSCVVVANARWLVRWLVGWIVLDQFDLFECQDDVVWGSRSIVILADRDEAKVSTEQLNLITLNISILACT
jgi:hypothetical protein